MSPIPNDYVAGFQPGDFCYYYGLYSIAPRTVVKIERRDMITSDGVPTLLISCVGYDRESWQCPASVLKPVPWTSGAVWRALRGEK